jgi:hypothetical protein
MTEHITVDLVLKLCTQIHFQDYSIEKKYGDTLITLKLSKDTFVRIVAAGKDDISVFAYYEGKDIIRNGAGNIEDIIEEVINILK